MEFVYPNIVFSEKYNTVINIIKMTELWLFSIIDSCQNTSMISAQWVMDIFGHFKK